VENFIRLLLPIIFNRLIPEQNDSFSNKSTIISKGISAGQSQNSYRGLVRISPNADNARNFRNATLNYNNCGAHTFLTSKAKTICKN
jgi:hypothetical protein